jgi:hypothetical protein
LRTICSGLCRFLVAMILSSLPAHDVGHKTLTSPGPTDRGQAIRNTTSDKIFNEIVDEIAHDFPWLADQCEKDKASHPGRVPLWVQTPRFAHEDAMARQRKAREVIRQLSVGSTVLVKWRSHWREAEVIEIRRTRIKAHLRLDDGRKYEIDRSAHEIQLP